MFQTVYFSFPGFLLSFTVQSSTELFPFVLLTLHWQQDWHLSVKKIITKQRSRQPECVPVVCLLCAQGRWPLHSGAGVQCDDLTPPAECHLMYRNPQVVTTVCMYLATVETSRTTLQDRQFHLQIQLLLLWSVRAPTFLLLSIQCNTIPFSVPPLLLQQVNNWKTKQFPCSRRAAELERRC